MQVNPKERLIAYLVGLVILMELIDSSTLNTSLPQMAYGFNVIQSQ